MSEEYGRYKKKPADPEVEKVFLLSETDKARIRAEEEFRAQLRAEAEAPSVPSSPAVLVTPAAKPAAKRSGCLISLSLIGSFLFLVFLFALALKYGLITQHQPDNSLSGVSQSDIQVMCEGAVERQLKAPSTADFDTSSPARFADRQWMWVSIVHAQNSFGASIRNTFICEVTGTTRADSQVKITLVP